MCIPEVQAAWIVHVKTRAINSMLRAFIASADNPAEAERLMREHCRLPTIDGVLVVVIGQLENKTALGVREVHGLRNDGVIEWPIQ